jgi:hypothetical protein
MVKDTLTRWPFIRQILSGGDGTGVEAMSARTRVFAPDMRAPRWLARSVRIVLSVVANSYITEMEN